MTHSLLFALPAELRNAIYAYALTSPDNTLYLNTKTKRFDVSSIGAGLLTTCRQVFDETRYLPVQLNRLIFEVPPFPSVSFTVLLAKLRRLEEDTGWILKMDVKYKQWEVDETEKA